MPTQTTAAADVEIRSMRAEDVASISAIDREIRGSEQLDFWKQRLGHYVAGSRTADKDARLCQVASVNGEVVGFVLGDIRGEEFDLPPCGWILNVGVRPAYRNQKIGQLLLRKLLDYIASQNISTVRTMVGWENAEMLSFFGSLGFDCGPYLPLEKHLNWS